MNARSFKVIFSKHLGSLVAVGENATSQGKGASGEGARGVAVEVSAAMSYVGVIKTLCLAALVGTLPKAFALDASALPTGAHVLVKDSVAVSSEGATMTITQESSRATINWQSFSVGSGAKVNIVQPSSSAALLNRVVGNEMSQIHGQISANGQVVLVNPNGVLVGSSGAITASAFTATTFGISDTDFNNDKMRFERNGSSAGVSNEGSIKTHGGYVALIGASVSNSGSISTSGGNALLGAGDAVSIPLASNIRLELDPAAFASVDNSGTITTSGGEVYMRASAVVDAVSKVAKATVTHSGTINSGGGRVDILADHGTVRVSGSATSNSDDGNTGGDIMIGRRDEKQIINGQEVTKTILAAVGDVSGAKLESKGGFVETSGEFLKTNNVTVLAKDWLLDPSDITISTGTDADYTNLSGIYTPNSGANTSVVNVGTIQGAINNGTSVTITTTNATTPGSGVGNITVVNELNLVNNSGTDATLKLIADNGIFVNANITGSTGTSSSAPSPTGLVNIDMLAKGNPQGSLTSANATQSSGIVVKSGIAINTNGNVTMAGTNNNTNDNSRGITFNSGSSVKAASFNITGTANGNKTGSHGVLINGGTTFTATATNVTSTIKGVSESTGLLSTPIVTPTGTQTHTGITAGTMLNGTNIRFNAGAGVDVGGMVVKGSNANTQAGVRVSAAGDNTTITTNGKVTLGQLEANSSFFMRAGTITAQTGELNILGQSRNLGVEIWGPGGISAGTTGNTVNVNIKGNAIGDNSAQNGFGVNFQRWGGVGASITSNGNITIEGTRSGQGIGSGLMFTENDWGSSSATFKADGNISLIGNNRATDTNLASAVAVVAGVNATAGGNITLKAETNNAASNAIVFTSRTALLGGVPTGLAGNTSLNATGANSDVVIQANQGGILMNNSALVTTPTDIKGRNITIDNTGGNIDSSTGAVSLGVGKATHINFAGVQISDAREITARGNLNIQGVSTNNVGVKSNGVLEANGSVNINGSTDSTNAASPAIFLTGEVTSSESSVSIKGVSTAATGGSGLVIQAPIKAFGTIALEGRSGNTNNIQGLVIQHDVTSTDGTITVTGETKAANQRAVAITNNGTQFGSLNTTDQDINIIGNTLLIAGGDNLTQGAFVKAGNGTVNIRTLDNPNGIAIGGTTSNDVMSTTPLLQKLGIDQTEFDRITAKHLVIGSESQTGQITIVGATDLSKFETVSLQTSSEGAIRDNFVETSVLTAKNLELLSGSVRMEVDHQVDTLAAIVKDRIEFENAKALSIGKVNNTVGITTTEKLGAEDNRIAVLIETYGGDLTVKESVTTANDKTFSVVLAAGSNDNRRETSSGNVIIENGSQITTGEGGQVVIFTGSIAGSTGVTTLAGGMGSGRYRYDTSANDTEANFTKALDASGVSVIYREQPEIKVAINDQNKTIDNIPFSGGTGNVVEGQLVNGDTLQNALTFGGNSQGAVAVGSYAIEGIAGDPSALGYKVTFEKPNAVLTIAAAPVDPVDPIDPVDPVDPVDPEEPINPFIPPVSPNTPTSGGLNDRGNVSLQAALSSDFRLASAEQGQCTQDTLEFCECETAKDEKGLNIDGVQLCFEPQRGAELR